MNRGKSECGSCGSSSDTNGVRFRSTKAAQMVRAQQQQSDCGTISVSEPPQEEQPVQPPGEEDPLQPPGDEPPTTGPGLSIPGGLDTETAAILGGAALGAAFLVSRRE